MTDVLNPSRKLVKDLVTIICCQWLPSATPVARPILDNPISARPTNQDRQMHTTKTNEGSSKRTPLFVVVGALPSTPWNVFRHVLGSSTFVCVSCFRVNTCALWFVPALAKLVNVVLSNQTLLPYVPQTVPPPRVPAFASQTIPQLSTHGTLLNLCRTSTRHPDT